MALQKTNITNDTKHCNRLPQQHRCRMLIPIVTYFAFLNVWVLHAYMTYIGKVYAMDHLHIMHVVFLYWSIQLNVCKWSTPGCYLLLGHLSYAHIRVRYIPTIKHTACVKQVRHVSVRRG